MAVSDSPAGFYESCKSFFPHEPNAEQDELLYHLSEFTFDDSGKQCFILKGYAGTGKTTLLGAYIKALHQSKRKSVLMAPTGRAAKVLASRSGKTATTIHKRIYFTASSPGGGVKVVLGQNKFKNTVFIVDEASMIGDFSLQQDGGVSRNLLEDVMEFVFQGENCRLIFLGDEGQLPPVGANESPALSTAYLAHHFPRIDFTAYGLTIVVRQESASGILINATKVRNSSPEALPKIDLRDFPDCRAVPTDELLPAIEAAYDKFGAEEVMVITRSNKRANLYNQNIRNRILYMEEEICGSDLIMVVKNNYFWVDPLSPAGFIANGELLKVHRVRRTEELYGARFVHLEVSLIDYPEMERFETIAFLDSLHVEGPNLDRDYLKKVFFEIEQDFLHIANRQKRYEEIMKSPYFNALQIKFAYAVTCHKAQGGQWSAVFVDHGYLGEMELDEPFLRWLYTAITRATDQLYFLSLQKDLQLYPQ